MIWIVLFRREISTLHEGKKKNKKITRLVLPKLNWSHELTACNNVETEDIELTKTKSGLQESFKCDKSENFCATKKSLHGHNMFKFGKT